MANSMIIHGKNQKIGCFYKLTTQISVKNGQNGLPSMGCRAGTSCGPRPFFYSLLYNSSNDCPASFIQFIQPLQLRPEQ